MSIDRKTFDSFIISCFFNHRISFSKNRLFPIPYVCLMSSKKHTVLEACPKQHYQPVLVEIFSYYYYYYSRTIVLTHPLISPVLGFLWIPSPSLLRSIILCLALWSVRQTLGVCFCRWSRIHIGYYGTFRSSLNRICLSFNPKGTPKKTFFTFLLLFIRQIHEMKNFYIYYAVSALNRCVLKPSTRRRKTKFYEKFSALEAFFNPITGCKARTNVLT